MPPFVQRRACQPGGRPHTARERVDFDWSVAERNTVAGGNWHPAVLGPRAREDSICARDCTGVRTFEEAQKSCHLLPATYVPLRVRCAKFSALQSAVEVEVASLMFLSRGLCLIACKCESQMITVVCFPKENSQERFVYLLHALRSIDRFPSWQRTKCPMRFFGAQVTGHTSDACVRSTTGFLIQ